MNVIIIGAGTSGVETARQIRFKNKSINVTLIDSEGENQYSPCSLPYFVEGKIKDVSVYDNFELDSINYYRKFKPIKLTKDTLTIKGKETLDLEYDKLVIAIGSSPIKILDEGFVLKTKKDAEKIKKLKGSFKIIGAGYIGLELAASLALKKNKVLVVEKQDKIMPGLDDDLAEYVQSYLESIGVKFKLKFKGEINSLKYDHLIQCVGFKPNDEIFKTLNLKYDKGLKINDDVFVVGDLARTKNKVTNDYENCMFANIAVKQAKIVAENVLGGKQDYEGFVLNAVSKVGDLTIGIVGSKAEVVGKYKGLDKYASCNGKDFIVKLYTDRKGVIKGGQIIGFSDVAGRLNMLSSFVDRSVYDLVEVDTCYNPCVSPIHDPLVSAGSIVIKKLEYLK